MSRSSRAAFPIFAGALLAAAVAVSACGGSASTPAPTQPPTASPSLMASAVASVVPSGSPAPSVSASPTPGNNIGLAHVDAALEDLLPGTIGDVPLEKFSEPLSTLVASSQGGEKQLYAPWLVKFGKTPDDVDVAIAVDFTARINFHVDAIQVPGVAASALSAGFSDVASKLAWPVRQVSFGGKSVLEITDPTAAKGVLGVGYVYAYDDVLYVVVTDDSSLLLECLIKLPPVS